MVFLEIGSILNLNSYIDLKLLSWKKENLTHGRKNWKTKRGKKKNIQNFAFSHEIVSLSGKQNWKRKYFTGSLCCAHDFYDVHTFLHLHTHRTHTRSHRRHIDILAHNKRKLPLKRSRAIHRIPGEIILRITFFFLI